MVYDPGRSEVSFIKVSLLTCGKKEARWAERMVVN
jgi:hypothetical protein